MKILLLGDFHYTLKQWDWLNQSAGDFDLIVYAGDLLDIASVVDKQVQILVSLKYLKMIGAQATLLVSSGNHDGDRENSAGELIAAWLREAEDVDVITDGSSWESGDGSVFTLFPWWNGPETLAEVEALLEREAAKHADRQAPWIWVYHAPPNDSPVSWTGKVHFGDPHLGGWIRTYQPAMVICGHVHQAPFVRDGSWVDRIGDTWVFNMGKQIGPVPAQIIVDTGKATAEWYSLAGAERTHLDRPLERIELG